MSVHSWLMHDSMHDSAGFIPMGWFTGCFCLFACLLVARVLYVLWIEEITYGWISVMVDVVVQSAYGVHSYKLFIYHDNKFLEL